MKTLTIAELREKLATLDGNLDSKARHTPGPWAIDGEFVYQQEPKFKPRKDERGRWHQDPDGMGNKGIPVARVVSVKSAAEANAKLIAAAPELLEALQYLIQDQPGTTQFEKWWDARVTAARAALAKAGV